MRHSDWLEQLAWIKRHSPRTRAALDRFPNLPQARVVVRFHIDLKMVPVIEELSRKLDLLVIPCHHDTTDRQGWEYLARQCQAQLETAWTPELLLGWLDKNGRNFLCDLGGDLICWATQNEVSIEAAMEGTTSGIRAIKALSNPPPFPVIDWNESPLKQQIHNEKMVGFSLWQTFTEVTRLSLHGTSVGLMGYGLVGRGIARTARALGGSVSVYEPDPERKLCAEFEGFPAPTRRQVLGSRILVTATGVPDALARQDLEHLVDGAFIINAGHSEVEIAGALRNHPRRRRVVEHVEAVRLDDDREIYLLAGGRLLNLAAGFGDTINAFDVTSALVIHTLAELMQAGAAQGS